MKTGGSGLTGRKDEGVACNGGRTPLRVGFSMSDCSSASLESKSKSLRCSWNSDQQSKNSPGHLESGQHYGSWLFTGWQNGETHYNTILSQCNGIAVRTYMMIRANAMANVKVHPKYPIIVGRV